MWGWKSRYRIVTEAVDRIRTRYPGTIAETGPKTIIGFSLGAFAALDIVHSGDMEWDSVMLIGAKIMPDAKLLARAKIGRVLLASGDYDMMQQHMLGQSRLLARKGISATFKSMGPVGHWFAKDMDAWMCGAFAWLRPSNPAVTPGPRSP